MGRAAAITGPAGIGFQPNDLSAVTGWLRIANRTDTGTLTIPDALGGPSATQSSAAQKPTFSTSNGFDMSVWDGNDDFLTTAVDNDSNNNSPTFGIATWIRPTNVTGVRYIHATRILNGASVDRVLFRMNGTTLQIFVYNDPTNARLATVTSYFTINTWSFMTWEFNGGESSDATKCVITRDGTAQSVTFSDGVGSTGAMPSTLTQPTGTTRIGRPASNFCIAGNKGANFYYLGGSGVSGGLITAAQRTNLMNFEPPE